MCRKLFFLTSFVLVLALVGSASAALPEGWQSQDIGTTDGSAAESGGMWIISADGADIWGSADEFHYAYVPLSGDGTIIAQVISNGEGSNGWAKGGVMIRETLDQGSKHAIMALTGGEGGGIAFQGRPETDGSSWGLQGDITASLPQWVKLTREGNTITGYYSADGVEWALMTDTSPDGDMTDPIDIEMAADVYIGLFATSHAAGEVRTYMFDNVSIELPEPPIPITDPDLLIYYDFESGEGEMAIDRSGHSNHGMFMGNPGWATGPFGGAVSIDIATIDYIETAAPLNIVSNTVTVTGWVKHDESPAGWSGILTHRGTEPGCLGLQHDGTELRYMWGADVYWSFSSGLQMPNGEWYFAALTIAPDQGKLYLIGENGIVQTATNVAEHEPTNFDSLIRVGRDHNDDRIMTSLIDEVRFYNRTLSDVDIQRLLLSDVTAPGDNVVGVPDDGDWPPNETPDLATDDDTSTKYLHFKGETEPTGFQIKPASGASIVTGLTLTTANDAIERDPISYELSGSNDSIDGPYELIASGDIVDFAQVDALPRFTMNATAISFENDVAYKYYQVMFPAVRDPGSANSMQIAEVELLGVSAPAGPVAYWKLDEGSGTTVVDSTGNIPDGTFEGDPQWVAGKYGTALELDGDDWVNLGTPPDLVITDAISISCWVNPTDFVVRQGFVHLDGGYALKVHEEGRLCFTTPGIADLESANTILAAGTWQHVAATFLPGQSEGLVFYLNGVETERMDSSAINPGTGPFRIGNNQWNETLTGLIDEIHIYDRILSADEIHRLAGPIAHYKLDDGEGVIAVDSSGNGLDGILIGDPLWSAGVLGGALDFDGVDDYVDCGNDTLFDFTDAFSLSVWINWRTPIGDWQTVVAKGDDAWRLARGGSTQTMDFGFTAGGDRGWQAARTASDVPLGEWHHVTATYDTTDGAKIYLDGVLEGTNTDTDGITVGSYPVFIGDNSQQTGRLWDGLIDDVRIYDRVLSAAEISELSGNILANGGFEDGVVEPWSTYGDATAEVVQELAGAAVPEAPIEGSSALHVVVGSAGANFWDSGLQHAGHVFEAGKQYTLSAFLKCSQGTLDINFKPELGEDPWTGYGSQAFTMTEEWTEFSVTTPVIDADVSPATITFHIGYAAAEFWVDGVRFVEVQ